jgi:hypothetical protein
MYPPWCKRWRKCSHISFDVNKLRHLVQQLTKYQTDFVCTLCFEEARGPQVRQRDYSWASLFMMQWLLVQYPGYDYDKVDMYRYLASLSSPWLSDTTSPCVSASKYTCC